MRIACHRRHLAAYRLLLLSTWLGLSLCATLALGQSQGSIAGRVQQDGKAITAHRIMLVRFGPERQVQRTPGETDAEGRFRFDNLDTSGDYTYFVGIRYQGQLYRSAPVTLQDTPQRADLVVDLKAQNDAQAPAPGEAPAGLSIANQLMVLVFRDQQLQVREVVHLVNAGATPYTGEAAGPGTPPISLYLPLPRGYSNLSAVEGLTAEHVHPHASGIYYTAPVAPGEHRLIYTYTLPMVGSVITLLPERSLAMGVLDILVEDAHLVAASDLPFGGHVTFEPHLFSHFRGTDLAPQARVWLQLSRRTPVSPVLQWGAYGLIVALALSGVAIPLYGLWRDRLPLPVATPVQALSPQALQASERRLLAHIVRLDTQREAGSLTEVVYQQRRQAYKNQLYEIARQLQHHQEQQDAHV